MADTISGLLMLTGVLFILLASIGILRLPDLFTRMSAVTKAATLGVGVVLSGTAVHFLLFTVTLHAIAIIVFLVLTAPVGAHLLARAAYYSGIRLWEGTQVDELREQLAAQKAIESRG